MVDAKQELVKRAFACGVAIAVVGWMTNTESTPPPRPRTERIDEPVDATMTAPRIENHDQSPEPMGQIPQKYSALLDQLPPLTVSRLRILLADTSSTLDLMQLAARERAISLLLTAEEYSLYEQLRESDELQAHLQTFADQVQSTTPIDPQQQRALLLAKLNHSPAAQVLALDPALDQSNIPPMERAYAWDVAAAGIDHHERAFLDEVRPMLTIEQWTALAGFERASNQKLLATPGDDHSAAPE